MDNIKVTQRPTLANPAMLNEEELRAALHDSNQLILELSVKQMMLEEVLKVIGGSVSELITAFSAPERDSESVAKAIEKFMQRYGHINTPSASVH